MAFKVFTTAFLVLLPAPALANELHIDKSETVLVAGGVLGVGGFPRGALTPIDVCDPSRFASENIGQLLGSALTKINMSLDPPTSDNYFGVGLGTKWTTTPTTISAEQINSYNESYPDKLPSNTRLFYHFVNSEVILKGGLLTLYTGTVVEIGTSFERREKFSGSYASTYFHNLLLSSLREEMMRYGCNK